jgi:hypothetical protein
MASLPTILYFSKMLVDLYPGGYKKVLIMADISNADVIRALNSIMQEGCMLQQVIEPQLDESIARQYGAERYYYVPGYIVICAMRL